MFEVSLGRVSRMSGLDDSAMGCFSEYNEGMCLTGSCSRCYLGRCYFANGISGMWHDGPRERRSETL
jgi:hypothetical protein